MPGHHPAAFALSLLLYCLPWTFASVYITHPYAGITCSGGSACMVTWLDDGVSPLLANVGPSDFALFQGTNTLVQQLATGLDVSQTRRLTFTPNSKAGPNANSYWIRLASHSAKNPNDTSQPYMSFSGRFTLDNMSGAEGSPVASLTSSLASSGAAASQTQTAPSSTTNGVVSTTTLSGVVPTGSASTLSTGISTTRTAASSSSSQSVTSSSRSTSQTASGTGSASAATGNPSNSSSAALEHTSGLTTVALSLVLVAIGTNSGLI